jgi:predicted nucleic acid-binding protein
LKIVLDTNVLVSALLKPNSIPGRILDLVLARQVVPALDDRVFAEYRDVFFRRERVQAGELATELPDPKDRMFIDGAVSSLADALVTGNIRHFPASQRHGVPVLTPRQFLDLWVGKQ